MNKSIKRIFSLFFVLVLTVLLVACSTTPSPTPETITLEDLESLVFEDTTFAYDGTAHSLSIDNIYEEEGVEITYKNNSYIIPGTYTVTATIKYENLSVKKEAQMIITKGNSILEMESVQALYLISNNFNLKYTLNNKFQSLVILNEEKEVISMNDISEVGVYNLEVYAAENNYYNESNHVNVTLNVIYSKYDISFDSKEVIKDGNMHSVELEGTLPAGVTVEYENNVGTEAGNYYATAIIKDENQEIIEKHYAVLKIVNPENEEFQKYLDEFFITYLEDDQLSVNIFCENPENFGFTHYDAKWYTFEPFTDDDIEHDLNLFKDMLDELEQFGDAELSVLQETAYQTIKNFLEYYIEYYMIQDSIFMDIIYVDQFGGYVADFGTYMEAYSLRDEQEVQDIIDYIDSTKTAFPSYLEFVRLKSEKGYALSDFTIGEMRTYLKDILDQGENYYLVNVLSEKINKLDFLTTSQKEEYIQKIKESISNAFIPGVQELYDGLELYLGKLSDDNKGYWTTYENGQDLYLLELKNLLGIENLNVEDYINEVETTLKKAVSSVVSTQMTILREYGISTWSEFEQIINSKVIYDGTPEEMMEYLKEFAKTIVPELNSEPNIVIKEMDVASAKVSNAVAYYMKSAIDNTASEYITLNPVKLGTSSSNDVLGTLAHEGYPGHLYAYVFSKELGLSNLATIMTSTAHGEGWATYVELKLYEYAKDNSTDAQFNQVMNYLYASALSGFLLETRLDIGIQYQGWKTEEIAKYMDNLGYSSDSAEEIYNLLIEIPTQYAAYGYGKLVFYNLHQNAQKILGRYYDEIEFNEMLLSKGWTNLGILQETYEQYMKEKCFELGIDY